MRPSTGMSASERAKDRLSESDSSAFLGAASSERRLPAYPRARRRVAHPLDDEPRVVERIDDLTVEAAHCGAHEQKERTAHDQRARPGFVGSEDGADEEQIRKDADDIDPFDDPIHPGRPWIDSEQTRNVVSEIVETGECEIDADQQFRPLTSAMVKAEQTYTREQIESARDERRTIGVLIHTEARSLLSCRRDA